ncbi:MAG: hypothetical protein Q9184_003359 [Pyrenodesmia sp. 2 TL-2023]
MPEVIVMAYRLCETFAPGKLSSLLWCLGSSLLHTGVVVKPLNREFAFGGHNYPDLSGVYSTPPGLEPPGGTFRCSILQGFTLRTPNEIQTVIQEIARGFPGPSYNLLTNNCNHFSSFLCEKLTGTAAPSWMNRAATIGIVLPCIVPREWVEPSDAESAEGELLVQEEEEDERAAMLTKKKRRRPGSFRSKFGSEAPVTWKVGRRGSGGQGVMTDTDGRTMPASERAPVVEVH